MALHMHGEERLKWETSELFNLFLEKTGGADPANFRGVCMEDLAAVEGIVRADVFFSDVDLLDVSLSGQIARITL